MESNNLTAATGAMQNMKTADSKAEIHVYAFKVGHRTHCGAQQARENRIVRIFGIRGQVVDLIFPTGLAVQLHDKILPAKAEFPSPLQCVAKLAAPSGHNPKSGMGAARDEGSHVSADGTSSTSPPPGRKANGTDSPDLSAAGDSSFSDDGPKGQGPDNVRFTSSEDSSFTGAGPQGQGLQCSLSYGAGEALFPQSTRGKETCTTQEGNQDTNNNPPTSAPVDTCGSAAAAPAGAESLSHTSSQP